jgi:amino acid adenylation domain-containing protein
MQSLGPSIAELQQFATSSGVELSTVWQTALAAMLHSYNLSDVVSFATEDGPVEKDGNVSICTLRIEPTETIKDLLRRFHDSKTAKYGQLPDHQISWTGFEQGQLKVERCRVAMRCYVRPGKCTLKEQTVEIYHIPLTSSIVANSPQLDILFDISQEKASRLTACMEYSAVEVSESLAWSMMYTMDNLLRDMGSSLQLPMEELSICSKHDCDIIKRFTSFVAPAEERCVHDLILDQCRATPNAVAITSSWEDDGDITYAQLDQLTSKLAHRLQEMGVGPEVFVLCSFEKSMWAIVARLAVLRAGGAYIMVCAGNPPAYLASIIRRANVQIMLTAPDFTTIPVFQKLVPTIIEVSRKSLGAIPVYSFPPVVAVKSQNACLILFTSGSTGNPKGIIQTHRSYATAIREYARILKLGPKTRLLQFDDYAFDISNNDYFAPLMTGGCCCVPQPFNLANPPTISKLVHDINALQANTTFLTPTVAIQIDPEQVKSLGILCIGGEAMPKDLLRKWTGKARLINQYGMGEVATFCAYNDNPSTERPLSVGRPGCNTIWLVSLSSPERLVPVGAVGEVLIEGPNIARGYLDTHVRITGARFLDSLPSWMPAIHPERASSPMYLSGDLARYNHDGTLEYVGRKDLLLKLDGCRVDAIEVEHCTRRSIHTNDAIVVDLLGNISETVSPILTAYLYLHDHPLAKVDAGEETVFQPSTSCARASSKVAEIEAALNSILPYHMIPTKFLIVNQIPKTGSKKTDRKKLHAQAEEYWKQESTQKRRFYLLTHPRTASNLLVRILALKNQPNVMRRGPLNIFGYFFLPAAGDEDRLGLGEKDLQNWSEDDRSKMMQAYQAGFDALEKYAATAEAEGKIAFVKEHAQFMSEPVSRFQFLLGEGSINESPWTVRAPGVYGAGTARSPLNKTLLPDSFLKTWLPTFLIRHPALTFPSQYRAMIDIKVLKGDKESDKQLPTQLTFHWSRKLYEFYAEYLGSNKAGESAANSWVREMSLCIPS